MDIGHIASKNRVSGTWTLAWQKFIGYKKVFWCRHHDVVVLEDELKDEVEQYEYDEYTNTQVSSKAL